MTDVRLGRLEQSYESHEERITDLEREERRTRKRLHDLEADRHAISLTTAAVKQLAERVGSAYENMEEIAEKAAVLAIEKDRDLRAENRWKVAVRVATILGGFAGVGYLLAALTGHG